MITVEMAPGPISRGMAKGTIIFSNRRRASPSDFPTRLSLCASHPPHKGEGASHHVFRKRELWLDISARVQSSGIALAAAAMTLFGAPGTQIARLASTAS